MKKPSAPVKPEKSAPDAPKESASPVRAKGFRVCALNKFAVHGKYPLSLSCVAGEVSVDGDSGKDAKNTVCG